MRFQQSSIVRLINLVRWEIRRVNIRREARLKWRTDSTKAIKLYPAEEGMTLDLVCTTAPQAVLRVADKTDLSAIFFAGKQKTSVKDTEMLNGQHVPSDEILSLRSQLDVIGKVQALAPSDNFVVRVMPVFGTERRPTNQTLKHDGSKRPPVTVEAVAMASENFRGDIIGCSDGRVGHQSPRPPPIIDLGPVADC